MEALDTLLVLAADRGAVLYNICFRRAGVGLQWYEEARCVTPEADTLTSGADVSTALAWMRERSQVSAARMREGLVVYGYHTTIEDAIEAERQRLTAFAPLEPETA